MKDNSNQTTLPTAKLFGGDESSFEVFLSCMEKAYRSWEKEQSFSKLPSRVIPGRGLPPWMLRIIDEVVSHTEFASGMSFVCKLFSSISVDHEVCRIEQLFIASLIDDMNIGVTMQLIPGYMKIGGKLRRSSNECQMLVQEVAFLRRKMAAGDTDAQEGCIELERILPQLCAIYFEREKADLVRETLGFASSESKAFDISARLALLYLRLQKELAEMVNGGMDKDTPKYSKHSLLAYYWGRVGWLLQSAVCMASET